MRRERREKRREGQVTKVESIEKGGEEISKRGQGKERQFRGRGTAINRLLDTLNHRVS